MNNKFKVKKGSSLVMVLVMMSILSVLGTAILSLTLSSYKMRRMNETLKTNFYGSEAGLDKAYGIIGKIVDEAIEEGNREVEKEQENLADVIEEEKLKILADTTYSSPYLNEDGSTDEEMIENILNIKFKEVYKGYVENNLQSEITNSDNYQFDGNGAGESFNSDNTKPNITPNLPLTFSTDDVMKVDLISTFKHEKLERRLQAIYEITVPEYKSVYYIEEDIIKIPENLAFLKGIAVDGDMKVEGSQVAIEGDIFVKGTNVDEDGNIIDEKNFESGVILEDNNSNVTIKGILSSGQNLFLKGPGSQFSVEGEAYVRNAIIDTDAESSNLNIKKVNDFTGSLFTMDDLELNAEKSHINIAGGYYGVSDGSASHKNNHSSSIIVNADDIGEQNGSTIEIQTQEDNDKVLIAGSSYIQLYNEEYQTGESVSIKGNYRAYTMPLTQGNPQNDKEKSLKEDNVIFQYKEPLALVSKFLDDIDLNVFDKSYYFKAYNDEYGIDEDYKLNLGGSGIKINKNKILSATGAVLATSGVGIENEILVGKYSIDAPEEIIEKSNELKRNIFYMGDSTILDSDLSITSILQQGIKYSNTKGKVDFSSITDVFKGKKPQNKIDNNSDVILLNKDMTKSYIFAEEGADTSFVDSISGNSEVVTVEKSNNTGDFRGIIITAGDIYFAGNIKFKGTIISGGSLIFKDNDQKDIKYDEEYVKRLIGYNYEDFQGVFKNDQQEKFDVAREATVGKDDTVKSDVIRGKLISRKMWKIIK